MAFAHLRRVECFLNRSEVADWHVRRLHFCYPVVALITCEYAGQDGTQLLLVGGSGTTVGKFGSGDEIGPIKHVDQQPANQPIVGAGHIEWSVRRLVEADSWGPVRRVTEPALIH